MIVLLLLLIAAAVLPLILLPLFEIDGFMPMLSCRAIAATDATFWLLLLLLLCEFVGQCCAANFIRFCFWRWLQNHTRTTFFLRSNFSAMAAIFSPDGRGWTAKYASSERFSGAAIEVLRLWNRLRYRLQQVVDLIKKNFWKINRKTEQTKEDKRKRTNTFKTKKMNR